MNFIYLGKLVNTHGIKGEVRILSNFKYKSDVFKMGNYLYINSEKLRIKTYRVHKGYDMVTFEGFNDIDSILKYKGCNVYIVRDDYNFDYLDEDLIGYDVFQNNQKIGIVTDLRINKLYTLLVINNKYLVPNISNFVNNIDFNNKKIYIIEMKGLIDEN